MIQWVEQNNGFGLDYPTLIGTFKDFKFDIRYDSDGDYNIKPNCGVCMRILFLDKEVKHIIGTDIEKLKNYANQFIAQIVLKYNTPPPQ